MTFSEQIDELFTALAKFHAECPPIKKDKTVIVRNKQKEFLYTFEYASYGNIMTVVRPILAKHGLSIIHNAGANGVQTILVHSSGQWAKTDYLPILLDKKVGDNTIPENEQETVPVSEQETGSSITYKKRYQVSTILALDTDMDDDGNTADGQIPEFQNKNNGKALTPPKPKSTPAPAPAPKPKPKETTAPSGGYEALLNDAREGKVEYTVLLEEYQKALVEADDQSEFQKRYFKQTQEVVNKLLSEGT